jgi:adenosine deaminase
MSSEFLDDPARNAMCQDYLSAVMKDIEEREVHYANWQKDIGLIEGAIEIVQEYFKTPQEEYDMEADHRGDMIALNQVRRVDAIHQLFNKLQEQLEVIGMSVNASIVDGLHHDFMDYTDNLSNKQHLLRQPIPNEDLATWIDG